jgi:opacity protein-like surface antigen
VKQISILALGLMLAAGAHAESTRPYISIGLGRASWNIDCSGIATCTRNHSALRLVGGLEVSKGLAAELFYTDFGKVTAADAGATAEVKAHAIGAAMALSADFSADWRGVLRLGVASVQAKGTASAFGASDSISKTSIQPLVGLGLSYAITPSLLAEAGYERTRVGLAGENSNVGLVTLGIGWRF